MRVQRGSFPLAHDVCRHYNTKWQLVYPLNYGIISNTCGDFFLKHTMVAPG